MTREEAIEHLSCKIAFCKSIDENWADLVHIDALKMAVRALQNQEPQRAIKPENKYQYICKYPSCGWYSVLDGEHCKHCWQWLDWSAKMGEEK